MSRSGKFYLFLISIFVFAGCQSRKQDKKQVFNYNESFGIASLDPAFAKSQSVIWAVNQLYNTLVETDAHLRIVPSLATRWEVSLDHLQYRFFLRNDVYFHDNAAFSGGKGRKMTAKDVVFSYQRLMLPTTASPGAWIFNDRVAVDQPFVALNDSVFQLTLRSPFSPILGVISNKYCAIVPKEVVEKFGSDYRSNPCGTGPFMFKSWEEGQALILHKNPQYFELDSIGQKLPYLDAIKVSFYDSKATEFLQFQQGRLDFINDIDPSFKDEVLNKKGELKKEWVGKIVLNKHPYLNTEYLG
ncbi:MAG: ABC transporter substrate-binding protein, partial [Chitinophagaceae bacterium]|nr:ABC transporter substrate-binding protein [Chitinophagaceae bacterium]